MPKSSITQLVSAAASELAFDDLLIGTIPSTDNYKTTLKDFVDYLKNYSSAFFPIEFNEKFINYNNTSSNISLVSKNINEIETITFDQNGCVINLTDKATPLQNKTEMYRGSIATSYVQVDGDNQGAGYFDGVTPLTSNRYNAITGPNVVYASTLETSTTSGNWNLLFNKTYEGYKKSVIEYKHMRLDTSDSTEVSNVFKFVIFWDGENKTRVLGTAKTGGVNNNFSQSFVWPDKTLNDNQSYAAFDSIRVLQGIALMHLMYIEVDGKNKRIKKLPIKCFVPDTNRETHTISITIKSFA
jgi:hypothetical protein